MGSVIGAIVMSKLQRLFKSRQTDSRLSMSLLWEIRLEMSLIMLAQRVPKVIYY